MTCFCSKQLRISIIIPVRSDSQNLRKCLKALSRTNYLNYECIVVDDCSTDETLDVAKQFPVKVLQTTSNIGPAHARNYGAKAASGDILLFIDADVLLYPDTVEKIVDTFQKRPEIDAVIGSYDDEPSETSFISQYKNLFHHFVHQNLSVNTCTFWSGCGAIRKKVFDQAKGFDVNFKRPTIEDIELGMRLAANHKRILLQKNVQVRHLKRWTFWGMLKTDISNRGIPWTVLLLQNKIFPNDLNIAFSQRICVILVYLLISSLPLIYYFNSFSIFLFLIPSFIILAVILINIKFYKFYNQKRGLMFTIRVVPFHLIYYFYSGLSFLLGVLIYLKNKFNASSMFQKN